MLLVNKNIYFIFSTALFNSPSSLQLLYITVCVLFFFSSSFVVIIEMLTSLLVLPLHSYVLR